MSNAWNYEELQATIYYNGGSLTISSDDTLNNRLFISGASASASENGSSNPFGIIGSRSYNIQVVDIDDILNPSNTSSPYYNKIRTGCKVEMALKDNSVNPAVFIADGTYGINNLSSSFSEGGVNECQISVNDDLSNLGSQKNPKLPIYQNITVYDFLHILFTSINVSDLEWSLDSSYTNQVLIFGMTLGTKVRDTLNGLAQYLQARITKDRNNIIKIYPAAHTSGVSYTLGYDLVNKMSGTYTRNTDYSKVNLTYNPNTKTIRDVILNSTNKVVSSESGYENSLENISFNKKVVSIEALKIRYNANRYNCKLTVDSFKGNQDTLEELIIIGENIQEGSSNIDVIDCLVYAEGNVVDKNTSSVSYPSVENSEQNAINIELQYIIADSEAEQVAQNLYNLVMLMSKRISIDTFATPFIDIGDTVILSDDDYQNYKGTYKVIGYNTTHGQDYNNRLEMIKIE